MAGNNGSNVIVVINSTRKMLEYGQPIFHVGMDSDTYEEMETELRRRIRQFDYVVNGTALGDLSQKDATTGEYKEPVAIESALANKKAILMSTLEPNFRRQYARDFKNMTNVDDIIKVIRESVGLPSAEEKSEMLEKELATMERRQHTEETYTHFLHRITGLAQEISSENADYIAKQKFMKALNRRENEYIRNFLTEEKTPQNIAKMMDAKQQYKKTATISIVNANENKLAEMDHKLEILLGDRTKLDKIEELTYQLTKLQAAQGQRLNEFEQKRFIPQPRYEPESQQYVNQISTNNTTYARKWAPTAEWQKDWKTDSNGYPVRCEKCGLRGHLEKECRGTRKTCDLCGQIGHTKFAGNHHSKNERWAQMKQ